MCLDGRTGGGVKRSGASSDAGRDRNIRLPTTFKEEMQDTRTRPRPSAARRTERRVAHAEPRPARSAARSAEQSRARRDAGPADRALYACGCGNDFQAGVSTSVACPRCAAGQAW